MSRNGRPVKREQRKQKHRFTKRDCQRGYQAALAKCSQSWELWAWFYYRYVAHSVM